MNAAHVACALCGADDARLLYRPAHAPGPVVVCRRCGLAYVNPRDDSRALIFAGPLSTGFPADALTSSDLDKVRGTWEWPILEQKRAELPALRMNAAAALGHLERYRQPPGRLLDYGCGGGFFLATARERGWESYGIEPLAGHAIHARSHSGAAVTTDTLRPDSYSAEFFDVVTAFQVFEHLPEPSAALHTLSGMLKAGGILLIEVPNFDTPAMRVLGARHRHYVQDHLYFFSERTLRALVRKYGLEPLEVYWPARAMTLRHLFGFWGKSVLGSRGGGALDKVATHPALAERIVTFGVGDVVAIVARKV